jgi:hypothetical protein
MELATSQQNPVPKGKAIKTAPVRVAKETRRRILAEVARLNKKAGALPKKAEEDAMHIGRRL